MKKGIIKNIIVTTLLYEGVSMVVSHYSKKLTKKNDNELQEYEKAILSKGYFVLTKYGVSKDFTKAKNKKIVWYSDAFCPDCRNAYKGFLEVVDKIKNGEVEIEFHPLNYMDRRSINNYSLKTSMAILGTAVFSPNKIYEELNVVYENPLDENDYNKEIDYFLNKALLDSEEIKEFNKYSKSIEYGVLKGTNNYFHNKKLKTFAENANRDLFIPFIYNYDSKELFDGENPDYKREIVGKILNI